MPTEKELRQFNQSFIENLGAEGFQKKAADAVNDWTRTRLEEDSFFDKLLPGVKIENEELDRRIETDLPYKIIDKQPNSPAAISVPFGQLPRTYYILGPRYGVGFDRVLSPRWTKDVDELRTYVIDIRQVLSDSGIRAMSAERDAKWISAVNSAMLGPDVPVPYNGNEVMWATQSGGVTRVNWVEALKIVSRGPGRLAANVVLLNNLTLMEIMKWGRDQMGGDYAQELAKSGLSNTMGEFMGKKLIVTIKRELVPDNSLFFFPEPKFLGKHFILEETTAWVKREAFSIEFFMYLTSGASIGSPHGLGRADLT